MMETRNLVGMILAVTVGLICIGTVMMPVLTDVTETHETLTNEGVFYITDDSEEHTIEFDSSDGMVVYVDGESIPNIAVSDSYTVFACDSFLIRTYTSSNTLQVRGDVAATFEACNLTISDGTISGTYTDNGTETTFEQTYTEYVLATASEESLVMKSYSGTANLLNDSVILGRGLTALTTSTTAYRYIQIEGTIEDGVEVSVVDDDGVWTVDNIVINAEENSDYVDLYTFTSITFDVTHVSTGAVTSCTYSAVIIPGEVSAETSDHMPSTQIAIIMVIPVLMIIAVLLVAVRGLTRYD